MEITRGLALCDEIRFFNIFMCYVKIMGISQKLTGFVYVDCFEYTRDFN